MKGVMLKAWPDRKNPPLSSDPKTAGMIGNRFADRIKATVKDRNAEHMTAPARRHHAKKSLHQGSHPHMTKGPLSCGARAA